MCRKTGVRFSLPDGVYEHPEKVVSGHSNGTIQKDHLIRESAPKDEKFLYSLLQCLSTIWFLTMFAYYSFLCLNSWLIVFLPVVVGALVSLSFMLTFVFSIWRICEMGIILASIFISKFKHRPLTYSPIASFQDGKVSWNKVSSEYYIGSLTRTLSQKFQSSIDTFSPTHR